MSRSIRLTALFLFAFTSSGCNDGSSNTKNPGTLTTGSSSGQSSTTAPQTKGSVSTQNTTTAPVPAAPQLWKEAVSDASKWSKARGVYFETQGQAAGPLKILLLLGPGDPCAIIRDYHKATRPIQKKTWELLIGTGGSTGTQSANVDFGYPLVGRMGHSYAGSASTVEFLEFDQARSPAKLRITTTLPLEPGRTQDCGSTESADGKKFGNCNCFDGDERPFVCDPVSQGSNCCKKHTKPGAPQHQLSFEIANVSYCAPKG